jgi:deoxyribodipyrimidine photo-lyase
MPGKTLVHLHTLDLRTHDLPSLLHAARDQEITNYLPIYIFDDRQLDVSNLSNGRPAPSAKSSNRVEDGNPNHSNRQMKTRNAPRSRAHELHRTSPYRLLHLVESVLGLRESYRRSGGDLIIGYGQPEKIVPKILSTLEGGVSGVYAQEEVTVEEANMLDRLGNALRDSNVELYLNDSKVAIPRSILPFKSSQVPDVYTEFRKKVEGLGVERGGMLVKPDRTTEHSPDGKGIKVKSLKPLPDFDISKVELGNEQGGFLPKDTTLETLYPKLAKPLLDNPPLGGWSSEVKDDSPPSFPKQSPIPFVGGEESGLARLDQYVGHSSGNGWQGGELAKKYKATRNGMIGQEFSTKFSEFFALGTLSAREVGWRVGELLEHVGRDKDTYNNVYCMSPFFLHRDKLIVRDLVRITLERFLSAHHLQILSRIQSITLPPRWVLRPDRYIPQRRTTKASGLALPKLV